MPRALTFTDLKRMARDRDRTVALLAAKQEKLDAVIAVLMSGICNTLVVDGNLGAALLQSKRLDGP